jgi:chondroitin AC lyase
MKKQNFFTAIIFSLSFFASSLYAEDGAENVAINKTATTPNGVTATGSDPANAVDGNESTGWESVKSYKTQLFIDLGKRYDISKIILKWEGIYFPTTIDILYSDTPLTVNNVDAKISHSNNPGPGPVTDTFDNINSTARYVGIQTRGRNNTEGYTGDHYRLIEFEVYGTENTDVYTPSALDAAQQEAVDSITDRLNNKNLTAYTSDSNPTSFFNSIQANGSWSDINYNDKISIDGWAPATHLDRLKIMAVALRTPTSAWFENPEMQAKIETGLLFYATKNPTATDNWWYTDIGDPQKYMVAALLLKGYSSPLILLQIGGYLKDGTTNTAVQGQNLAWESEIVTYKGCIENDFSIVEHSFETMASTLKIVTTQGIEGIKIDGSFHQHHAQIYSGGYGLSITDYISTFMELANGTLFYQVFTPEKIEIFRNTLLNGHRLLGYRSVMDFGTFGRNISRNGSGANISATVLDRIASADPPKVSEYQTWKAHLSGAPFPAPGNKHFWKSDIMTQHGENYYLSAKIISKRTYGTECLNTENLLGYNLPLGATNILTSGTEYKGIYPTWDWTKVPGTTSAQDTDAAKMPDGYLIGSNDFGGGVSNGAAGVIAYEHNYKNVQAYKAYFMMSDAMVCLGSNIRSTNASEIATSVNQCFLKGTVSVSNGETTATMAEKTSNPYTDLKWVHHNNVGYIFPKNGNVTLSNVMQTGSWGLINGTAGSTPVRNYVFSAWISHGTTPENGEYQYIVVPDKTVEDFQAYTQNHGFVVVRNDNKVQAVRNDKSKQAGIVFHAGESADLGNGWTITSNKPALVLIEQTDNECKLSVADPKYAETTIQLILNKQLSGNNAEVSGNNTTIAVNLPTGEYKGSSVTNSYTDLNYSSINQLELNDNVVLHPNPAHTMTTICFERGIYSSLLLYRPDGKMITSKSIASSDTQMNLFLNGYQQGIYLIRLTGKNKPANKKLLILNHNIHYN